MAYIVIHRRCILGSHWRKFTRKYKAFYSPVTTELSPTISIADELRYTKTRLNNAKQYYKIVNNCERQVQRNIVATCFNSLQIFQYLRELLTKRSDIHQRSTRSLGLLQIPLYKTSAGQRSFNYRGMKLWNDLDDRYKALDSIKDFKKELKHCFLEHLYN